MPASIHITKEQIARLAELDSDVVANEQHLIADALDFWVLDESTDSARHRSIVIEEDGTVLSDIVIPNSI